MNRLTTLLSHIWLGWLGIEEIEPVLQRYIRQIRPALCGAGAAPLVGGIPYVAFPGLPGWILAIIFSAGYVAGWWIGLSEEQPLYGGNIHDIRAVLWGVGGAAGAAIIAHLIFPDLPGWSLAMIATAGFLGC